MRKRCILFCLLISPLVVQASEPAQGLVVDKAKRTVTIPCRIAPRKIDRPGYDKIYPIEVVATYPKGDGSVGAKAHETVVVFDGIKPSEVHKALESLGLKPGKPAVGEGSVASGPELRIFLEVAGPDGQWQRHAIEKTMSEEKTGKPLPPLKWHFTGSALKQPDPDKDEKVYGADLTGTLIAIFPVTDDTVVQAGLRLKDQEFLRLETNKTIVPKEGTPVRLVLEAK